MDRIPGIEAYIRAFKEAKQQHGSGTGSTPATRETCRRIEAALDAGRTLVLFCRDNGHGLNAERMSRLLAEGSGDKGGDASSAGSFGVGHLTAFAASDLRYALYGGRAKVNGTLRDSVSGHVVLATHVRDGSRRAGNGYWLDRSQIERFEMGQQPDLFDGDYPLEIPELLDPDMAAIGTTGAVVCILGFNRFRGEGLNVAGEIRRVASTNFLAAIEHGEMVVRIVDEPADVVCDLNRESLSEDLLEFALQRRSRKGSGGGWFVGAQAHAAWTTLQEGDRLRGLGDGIDVRIRRLDADGAFGGSRVNVFRTGMWVTNGVRHLHPSDFTRQNPFDAVVLLRGEGELCRLVRDAEGPEHRTIEEKRLEPVDRERLFDLFREIADRLRAEAGDVSTDEPWQPSDFAVFRGTVLRGAEELRPYRPRASAGREVVVGPKPGPGPGPKPSPDVEPNPRRPKPGRGVQARIAHRLIPGSGGSDRLDVRLKVEDRKIRRPGAQLGLRVRRDSGSDESCSSP